MSKTISLNNAFSKALLAWYRANKRDLPWRRTKDPYRIWVSEIMLQQTTVKAVLGYYENWLRLFPTVKKLASSGEEQVLKAWQGLGYYNRARNLKKAAEIIVKDHGGEVPADPEVLKRVPGFGPYTVGAVLSIAYDKRLPIIDANVRRVFMRLLGIHGLADARMDKKILPFIDKVLPQRYVGDFNQGLMELGAMICRSKEPICNLCPVRRSCKAYAKGVQEVIPQPKRTQIKDIKAVVAIIRGPQARILIQKRPDKGLLAGLWEFPGGKVEARESLKKALERELLEELGVQASVGQKVSSVVHFYTQYRVNLTAFECVLPSQLKKNKVVRWVTIKDLFKYPMPSGSAKIAEDLRNPRLRRSRKRSLKYLVSLLK